MSRLNLKKNTKKGAKKKVVKKRISLKKQIEELGREAARMKRTRKKKTILPIVSHAIEVLKCSLKGITVFSSNKGLSLEKKKQDLVCAHGFLEATDHQRRDIRNLLSLVKKGKYIALAIRKCLNFPNLGFLSGEMNLLGADKIHGSLDGQTMHWIGKKK